MHGPEADDVVLTVNYFVLKSLLKISSTEHHSNAARAMPGWSIDRSHSFQSFKPKPASQQATPENPSMKMLNQPEAFVHIILLLMLLSINFVIVIIIIQTSQLAADLTEQNQRLAGQLRFC